MDFFFDEAAGIGPITEDHVLQFAFAALVAHGAVERMVGQQEFEHELARISHLFRIRSHHHAFGYNLRATRLELRSLLHFDQAHAASALQRQSRVVAERRNLYSEVPRRFNNQRAGRNLDLAVVDFQLNQFRFCHGFLPRSDQIFRGFVRAFAVQVIFKLLSKLRDYAYRRHSRCVAERAEGAAQHVFC